MSIKKKKRKKKRYSDPKVNNEKRNRKEEKRKSHSMKTLIMRVSQIFFISLKFIMIKSQVFVILFQSPKKKEIF